MRKRICSMVIVLAVFLSLVPQCFAEYAENGVLELFVDSKASGGDGSFAAPFSSFEEARDYIRTLKANGQYPEKGVTVNFRGGTYYLNAGLKLTAEDSGTESAPITYRSYGNERAEFVGGAALNVSDFKSVKTANPEVLDRIDSSLQDKIKVVDLHDYGLTEYGKLNPIGWMVHYFSSFGYHPEATALDEIAEWMNYTPGVSEPELFVDGTTMTLARYPNGEEMSRITSVPDLGLSMQEWDWVIEEPQDSGNFVRKDGPYVAWEDMVSATVEGDQMFKEHAKKWSKAPDIWAYGYWTAQWADMGGKVRSVDTEKGTLTMQTPVWTGVNEGQSFYVYNLLEELDTPGEWYLERETGKLYLYPPSDNSKEISLSLLEDNILDLQNVSDVNIKKMDFRLGRKDGIDLTNCKRVNIELCNIGNIGYKGIVCNGDCRNVQIISNYLYDLGNGGITTVGGDSATLEHSDNLVENNWLYNYCRKGGQSSAVYVAGVGDIGRHNKIHESTGGAVIGCGGAYSVLEYNEVFDVMKKAADAGICYSYQSVAVPGKEIRNNYFHDIASTESKLIMGIYVDGMGHGHTVTSNVFENVDAFCIWFNGGWHNTATDNIFINCASEGRYTSIGAPGGEGLAHQSRQVAEVTETLKNPAYKQFTWMQDWLDAGQDTRMIPQQNVFKDNVRVNTDEFLYASYSNIPESDVVKNNDIQKSLSYDSDPGFENMGLGNYALKESSDIYSKIEGFNAPEFKKMGLYTPWLAYKLKGTLALAIDSQTAYKDFDETYIDAEDRTVVPTIVDDLTYLPIRFIAENNGGDADFDEESGTATILLNGSEMLIDLKNKTISVNGELLEGYAPIIRGGRSLIPVRALEAMGKTVTWYGDQRMVIISDGEAVLEQEETELLNELARRLS